MNINLFTSLRVDDLRAKRQLLLTATRLHKADDFPLEVKLLVVVLLDGAFQAEEFYSLRFHVLRDIVKNAVIIAEAFRKTIL